MMHGTPLSKATREHTKAHNEQLVLRLIFNHAPISRADLARLTGLTRATISRLVGGLIGDGLVTECGFVRSSVGKPATMLGFHDNASAVISIDLANRVFQGQLTNLRGKVIHSLSSPSTHARGESAILEICDLIDKLVTMSERPVIGIGIGAPGVVEPFEGRIRRSADLLWEEVPLKAILERELGYPTQVANDCQSAAFAESLFGLRERSHNLILVKAGRGVGAGIIIRGEIFHGDGYGAGEIGHVVVDPDGDLCQCGRRGCLETIVGTKALRKRLHQHADTRFETLVERARAGDSEIGAQIALGGKVLGNALAVLVGALNIKQVALAGRMTAFGDLFLHPLRRHMMLSSIPLLAGRVQVDVSTLGSDIVNSGAAALVLRSELGVY